MHISAESTAEAVNDSIYILHTLDGRSGCITLCGEKKKHWMKMQLDSEFESSGKENERVYIFCSAAHNFESF